MSNAIDNARKALERFGTAPGKSDPEVHNASLALAAALRELLESVEAENRTTWETYTGSSPVSQIKTLGKQRSFTETRYVTPWERA